MNYYLDQEFISHFIKPLFGKKRHVIDLISIGIVAEDGREYSAISSEYNYNNADQWVRDNVIKPLYHSTVRGLGKQHCCLENFHHAYGKTNKQIAWEIKQFVYAPILAKYDDGMSSLDACINHVYDSNLERENFYGYYADYDWVLFCSLFGRMIDLPKGFPMYCLDLKQMLDDLVVSELRADKVHTININNLTSQYLKALKENPHYPKQVNAHDALADARWNKDLHKFLK